MLFLFALSEHPPKPTSLLCWESARRSATSSLFP